MLRALLVETRYRCSGTFHVSQVKATRLDPCVHQPSSFIHERPRTRLDLSKPYRRPKSTRTLLVRKEIGLFIDASFDCHFDATSYAVTSFGLI